MTEIYFPVSEIFGPVMQGEGPQIGRKCVFVRFMHCDSDCIWCDTKYTWKVGFEGYSQNEQMTVAQIRNRVFELDPSCKLVILTGGNPAIQRGVAELMRQFGSHVKFSVETQGTLYQQWFQQCDWVIISPKLSSAQLSKPITPEGVADIIAQVKWNGPTARNIEHGPKIALKFVIADNADLDEFLVRYYFNTEIVAGIDEWCVGPVSHPSDTTEDLLKKWATLSEQIMEVSTRKPIRVTAQLHTILYGFGRGF